MAVFSSFSTPDPHLSAIRPVVLPTPEGCEECVRIATVIAVLSVVSISLSCAVVNTVYALKYARHYYVDQDGGFDFCGAAPAYTDFAFVAFTVGMTLAVGETAPTTSAIRRAVLGHAFLSYVFGTGILAVRHQPCHEPRAVTRDAPRPRPRSRSWRPARQAAMSTSMNVTEFLAFVEREADLAPPHAERAVQATLETLGERISSGECDDLAAELPEPLATGSAAKATPRRSISTSSCIASPSASAPTWRAPSGTPA